MPYLKYKGREVSTDTQKGDLEQEVDETILQPPLDHGSSPYYYPIRKPLPKTSSDLEEKPIKIEDYRLDRGVLFGLKGFFDPRNPKVTVIGKYLNPEESINVGSHEEHHWRMHKNNGPQREYDADVHAKVSTGINNIRYSMHNYGVRLRNVA